MTPDITVLGAGGRIGRALVTALLGRARVRSVGRSTLESFLASDTPAGHVISCIGLTADFRSRPLDTAEAHVGLTARILRRGGFESLLYLSSTRVYAGARTTRETAQPMVRPWDPGHLYNLTKLTGEALCLADPRPTVRVVRLSNVIGGTADPDAFLGQVMQEGARHGAVTIRQAARSSKDYVALADVVDLLPRIAGGGRHRLYNVARGTNTTHAELAALLRDRFGWTVDFAPDAPAVIFPPINIARLRAEFAPTLSDPLPGSIILPAGQEALCLPSMKRAAA